MALEIFKLMGSIYVNNDKANESIAKTDKKASGLSENFVKGVNKAAKWGTAIVTAAGAAGTALMAMANNTAETADKWDKLSLRTGIGVENLQKWGYAASQSGADIEKLETGIKKLSDVTDSAVTGNKAAQESFKKLGISMEALKDMSPEEVFEEVMFTLSDMESGTARNALGNDLLGKSYTELLPLLEQGSDGMEGLRIRAEELGIVMSEDAVSAGVTYGDLMADVKDSLNAAKDSILTGLMPTFNEWLQWILTNMPTIQQTASTVFNAISTAVKFLIDNSNWLIPVLAGVLGAIVALNVIQKTIKLIDLWKASTLKQTIAQGGLNAVLSANPIGVVVLAIGALIAAGVALWRNWDTVKSKASALWEKIKSVFDNVKNKVQGTVEKIKGFFNFKWEIPKIKLPHFKVSGSANPLKWLSEGTPKLSVDWYSQGAIFTEPTILGGIGVGDANNGTGSNAEAVLPIDKLPQLLMKAGIGMTVNIYSPEALTPSETSRQFKKVMKELSFSI